MTQHRSTAFATNGPRARRRGRTLVGIAAALGILTAPATAATTAENPYQRGPDPTPASVAAVTGPFATASVTVSRGNGFGGGTIYYPTATNEGTFGALAISPGLNGTWPGIAWLGPGSPPRGSSCSVSRPPTSTTVPPAAAPNCSRRWTT